MIYRDLLLDIRTYVRNMIFWYFMYKNIVHIRRDDFDILYYMQTKYMQTHKQQTYI